MNKHEAIEVINNIDTLSINDMIAGQNVDMVIKNQVIDILKQIDTQLKVVVPKFMAEYIERCKKHAWHLQKVLSRLDDDVKVGDWVYDENDDLIPEKVDIVAYAWLFGYEVEKEQLYTVEIPNPNEEVTVYLYRTIKGCVAINTIYKNSNWKEFPHAKLTESEIKKDFAWAWQWAETVSE